jgi:kynurenine formamidase
MRRFPTLVPAFVAALSASRLFAQAPDLATSKVVDLTHTFDEKTIYWPTSPSAFALKRLADGQTPGGWYYASNAFCTPEHGGTHLDAPVHFAKGGRSADQIPVRQLIAPAAVLDVRPQAAADPDYRLTAEEVRGWEKRHGRIAPGTIVLLRTGWSVRWPDRKAYLGDDAPGDASKLHFPSYGKEAAELLVGARRVGALGVDTASIDYGASQDFVVHRIASGAGVPGLENVARLEELPEAGAWVIALPMKIGGGSGGPLRIVAVVPSRGPEAGAPVK